MTQQYTKCAWPFLYEGEKNEEDCSKDCYKYCHLWLAPLLQNIPKKIALFNTETGAAQIVPVKEFSIRIRSWLGSPTISRSYEGIALWPKEDNKWVAIGDSGPMLEPHPRMQLSQLDVQNYLCSMIQNISENSNPNNNYQTSISFIIMADLPEFSDFVPRGNYAAGRRFPNVGVQFIDFPPQNRYMGNNDFWDVIFYAAGDEVQISKNVINPLSWTPSNRSVFYEMFRNYQGF